MILDIISEISLGYSFNSQKTELNPFLAATVKSTEGDLSLTSRAILKFFPFGLVQQRNLKKRPIYLPQYWMRFKFYINFQIIYK